MSQLTNDQYAELINRIFAKLKEMDINNVQVAQHLGVSPGAVSKWKKLVNKMDGSILFKLAEFAGITLSFSVNEK